MSRKRPRIAERFAMLPVSVMISPAFRDMKAAHQRVVRILAAQYDGANNGDLTLTRKQARNFGLMTERDRCGGLREAEKRGLILKTRAGGVKHGSTVPTLWALSWRQIDYSGGKKLDVVKLPPNAWRNFSTTLNVSARTTLRVSAVEPVYDTQGECAEGRFTTLRVSAGRRSCG